MVRRTIAFTLVGIVALGGVASATSKVTPALSKGSSDSFVCRVANTDSDLDPIEPQVQIIGSFGQVLEETTLRIYGGSTSSAVYDGSTPVGYCRVEGAYSRKRALVTFCVMRSGSFVCESPVGDPGL